MTWGGYHKEELTGRFRRLSKRPHYPNLNELRHYYDDVFAEFFPEEIAWRPAPFVFSKIEINRIANDKE